MSKRKKKKPERPLTDQQRQACRMRCVDGMSVQAIADALGVHRCTLWRWSCTKAYNREWNRLLEEWRRSWRESHRRCIRSSCFGPKN